jgi:hypothetical protein
MKREGGSGSVGVKELVSKSKVINADGYEGAAAVRLNTLLTVLTI